MRKQIFIFLCVLSILSYKTLLGQILPFHNYTMKDGLISDNVVSVCQDSLGYIWIGTGEGISIFNSRDFKNISTTNLLYKGKIYFVTVGKNYF